MIGALIMAIASLPGDNWSIRCERPNPRGFMEVTVAVPTDTALTLLISDAKGKLIKTVDVGRVRRGTHRIYMNTGRLDPGIYLLVADGLEEHLVARVLVAR